MEESTANTVVKVFAILDWIGAAGLIIAGIVAMVMGPTILLAVAGSEGSAIASVIGGFAVVLGIITIAIGALMIFVGRGLWQHKNWARIVTLVFAVLGVLGIFSGNFLGAIIGAVQIWLFGFDKSVKALFGK